MLGVFALSGSAWFEQLDSNRPASRAGIKLIVFLMNSTNLATATAIASVNSEAGTAHTPCALKSLRNFGPVELKNGLNPLILPHIGVSYKVA